MFVRVVRFTDVTAERIQALKDRVEAAGGPPEGVRSSGMEMFFDEGAGTAVVVQHYETRDDMETSAKIFEAMDPGDTPGTRASVDSCEVMIQVSAAAG